MSEKLKAAGVMVVILAAVLAFAFFSADSWQRGQIFHGSTYMARTPRDIGAAFSDQWIDVPASGDASAGKIHAWWIPAAAPDAPAVLFLHGNAGSISSNLRYVDLLHAAGLAVLTVDYRGFGTSSAALPSEKSVYADARAAWDRFVALTPKARKRLVYGQSLGGAIAIDLASKVKGVDALVEESSFTSMLAEARIVMPGWIPLSLIQTQYFSSDEKIGHLYIPKLFIHCSGDEVVPGAMSEELYRLAPEPKSRLVIAGGSHNDCPSAAPVDWTVAVLNVAGFAGRKTPDPASKAAP